MTVLPPAANLWDVPVITAAALAQLRLQTGDVDQDRVAAAADAAADLLDDELDRVTSATEPPLVTAAFLGLVDAAVQLTVELYQRKDLAPDADPVAIVRAQVRPWKQRWGIA